MTVPKPPRLNFGDIRRQTPQPVDLRDPASVRQAPRAPVYAPPPPGMARRRTPVTPRPVSSRPVNSGSRPVAAPTQNTSPAHHRPIPSLPKLSVPSFTLSSWVNWLQYPLIAGAALAAAFNSTAGQLMVAAFGIYALVRQKSARLSFGAALFVLLTIPLFQLLGRQAIAEHAAIYVYELLVIGTVSALIELRKSGSITE